ncbi:MAG: phosphoribosylglycinamide formyltransferase [Pseudomonadota bacterium]|nr:phosphoribosylglycinamide formyltransferase [Pseudomonadota bacterium]|tara:strand:+ start:73 stop:654 length:582 start_codon:yes stop_codon:yes gene_type:complete
MKKLGILVSGRGSNMTAIVDACKQGYLLANVEIVISDNPDAEALIVAKERKINTIYFDTPVCKKPGLLDTSICEVLRHYEVDLVLLAGYMKMIGPIVLSVFEGKILNVHPSLLPKYGGQGMYGVNVHRAVIDAGEKKSGATIHLVNSDYDKGKILAQKSVIVDKDDTPESLAKKILEIEHALYVETIQKIIEG